VKTPPHNKRAELAVLGACINFRSKIDEVSEILSPADFYVEANGIVYQAILDLSHAGRPVDEITLPEYLGADLERVGGLRFIGDLCDAVPTGVQAAAHAQVVRNHARVREGIGVCLDGLQKGYASPDPTQYLNDLAQAADEASTQREKGTIVSAYEAITPTTKTLSEQRAAGREITGIRTGFPRLDKMTSGLQPSDLIVIAGRPSMGKTALAMNIAVNASMLYDVPTLVFSLEMSEDQLMRRVIGSQGNVPGDRLRFPVKLQDEDWDRIDEVANRLKTCPLHLDCSSDVTIYDIKARARQAVKRLGIRLIVIDYLQFVKAIPGHSRDREVAEITRVAKSIAKALSLPVILVSQLNRGVESRTDKRPTMADVRDSGAIEQDADEIIMLYREAFYNADCEHNEAEALIRKNRNGPVGTVKLLFEEQFTRFVNPGDDYVPRQQSGGYGV